MVTKLIFLVTNPLNPPPGLTGKRSCTVEELSLGAAPVCRLAQVQGNGTDATAKLADFMGGNWWFNGDSIGNPNDTQWSIPL